MNAPPFPRFEGSYMGDRARLSPAARLECKVCWHVYDPAEGCEVWQVPPGTAFADLPEHWRCPVCDGAREQFMVLDGGAVAASPAEDPRLAAVLAELPAKLEATFREIHAGQLRGAPFVNEALQVKAVGFSVHEGRILGVLVTPWFMNLMLLPGPDDDWSALRTGAHELVEFPSGVYEFVGAVRRETGPYKSCSLFSPMGDFKSQADAVATAEAVLPALFDPANREEGSRADEIRRLREAELAKAEAAEAEPVPPAPGLPQMAQQKAPEAMSRRALLFGAQSSAAGESEAL